MAKRRTSLPDEIEAQILFASDHTCCICRERGKDVQIHHIDSDPSNNHLDNLVVLCPNCHSLVTGPRGFGRSFKPKEVSLFKQAWEQYVRESRGVRQPDVPYKQELVSQVDLIICEILALGEDERALTLIEQLLQLHLWRGSPEVSTKIVDGITHLGLMTGLSTQHKKIAMRLPSLFWELCWHFVGPDELGMDDEDRAYVRSCIEGVRTFAHFNAQFGKHRDAPIEISGAAESFADLAILYDSRDLASAVLDFYKDALDAGRAEEIFLKNQHELLRSLQEVKRRLGQAAGDWATEIARVDEYLREYGLVYFDVSSKEGYATLVIEHPAAEQSLVLPVHPNEAVTEALPLLESDFAHLASQWQKLMVVDPSERDANAFFLEARSFPTRIADPANAEALTEIAWRHLPDEIQNWLGGKPPPALGDADLAYSSNICDFAVSPDEFGLDIASRANR